MNNYSFYFSFVENARSPDVDISRVGMRVMDELVKPLTEVQIDDTEFACLKAIVFFDPSKYGELFNFFSFLLNVF